MAKYIIVCGGVISGIGKGVAACSIGLLLRLRNLNVNYVKFDPYLNIDAGIISPRDHGEVYLCSDGSETDLDLGHAERLIGIEVGVENICTSGTLYKQIIDEQVSGKYLGATIQAHHIAELVQERLLNLGKDKDVVIAEIGGSVCDVEGYTLFEAVRQFKRKVKDDLLLVLVAPILYIGVLGEFKTKPLQNSVKELHKYGLQPDVIFCRCERDIPENIIDKVAAASDVEKERVIEAPDAKSIYQVPIEFYDRHVDDLFVDMFRLPRSSCRIHKYRDLVEKSLVADLPTVDIGVFGKYDNYGEAYLSLKEAIVHAGLANDVRVNVRWIKAESLEKYKDGRGLHKYFDGLHGVIVPGGFDVRGVEGKIRAIEYTRTKKIPFLGICLGLQCAVIEFARNVCNILDANSVEFDKNTSNPVVHFVEGQENLTVKLASMRLGSYECELVKGSIAYDLYENKLIKERHRHRYEVNPRYVECYKKNDFHVTGENPGSKLIEIMELGKMTHPHFMACQYHPEYQSRLTSPSPLFRGLVKAAVNYKNNEVKII